MEVRTANKKYPRSVRLTQFSMQAGYVENRRVPEGHFAGAAPGSVKEKAEYLAVTVVNPTKRAYFLGLAGVTAHYLGSEIGEFVNFLRGAGVMGSEPTMFRGKAYGQCDVERF